MDEDKGQGFELVEQHIETRRGLGRYLDVMTKVHRAEVEQTNGFVAHIRAKLRETEGDAPDPGSSTD